MCHRMVYARYYTLSLMGSNPNPNQTLACSRKLLTCISVLNSFAQPYILVIVLEDWDVPSQLPSTPITNLISEGNSLVLWYCTLLQHCSWMIPGIFHVAWDRCSIYGRNSSSCLVTVLGRVLTRILLLSLADC